MKYKALLVGGTSDDIKNFFTEDNRFFECFSASLIAADFENAIKYFQPDIVIYYMEKEDGDQRLDVARRVGLKSDTGIPLIIIGDRYEYGLYMVFTEKSADLFLQRDNPFASILESIWMYVERIDSETGDDAHEPHNEPWQKGDKKHILVIDDSPVMLRAISRILDTDYKVATAISAEVARRYLRNKPVDLILLDYEMPGEDGMSFFERLKGDSDTARIPVIFLSGVKDAGKIRGALSLQPEGYMLKPVDARKLMEKIDEVL